MSKRLKNDKYMPILADYVSSVFQDFESNLRAEIFLVEGDIILVSDKQHSNFITYEITPGFYAFRDLSEEL